MSSVAATGTRGTSRRPGSMQHLLTIDVEAAHRGITPPDPPAPTDRQLPGALHALLDMLADTGASATFFVLGADVNPLRAVLPRCRAEGHEVACHGMQHRRADRLSATAFRADLRDAIHALEDVVQAPCRGYRAPWFSPPAEAPWYADALCTAGLRYDASPRQPVESRLAGQQRNGLILVPVPLLKIGALRIGALGGLALRLAPRAYSLHLIRRCERFRQPACLYLHPYEWYGTRERYRTPGGGAAAALRRGLLTGRTIPRLRWLAGRVDLTAIATWIEGRPQA